MTYYEPEKNQDNKSPRHSESAIKSSLSTTSRTSITPKTKHLKLSREDLRKQLVARDDETDITPNNIRSDIYFDFPNPYNLIFTVYYNTAQHYAVHKDFPNPTKAFQHWIKRPVRGNSYPFISVHPQNSPDFPQNFQSSGLPFQIALRYIEYLDKIEEWVKFLEESHPNDLK